MAFIRQKRQGCIQIGDQLRQGGMAGWQGQMGKEWPSILHSAWIIKMWKESLWLVSTLGISSEEAFSFLLTLGKEQLLQLKFFFFFFKLKRSFVELLLLGPFWADRVKVVKSCGLNILFSGLRGPGSRWVWPLLYLGHFAQRVIASVVKFYSVPFVSF